MPGTWRCRAEADLISDPDLHVVLYHPEIPPNTGNIGRLCVGVGIALHVVHPIGFSMDERNLRRAGLDYWKHVDLMEHPDEPAFWRWAQGRRLHLFSSHGDRPYTQCRFQVGDALLFGRETVGLPKELVAEQGAWRIPMTGPTRSLNVSNAVAVVVYQALQQVRSEMFGG
ncbi:MAG: tRNA (cytidine(34)-2'-O)-methyltransferase [Deltaproteobacteria bacterium]|nr:tRNA (cytidine(34)-2'-O)-methyltransferase [Deltaproteobacteria bacterium]MBW2254002.1 tRNA (cytidine(34)-2'-O)-methyltransferase [Deltaproteobacteria bacterium]